MRYPKPDGLTAPSLRSISKIIFPSIYLNEMTPLYFSTMVTSLIYHLNSSSGPNITTYYLFSQLMHLTSSSHYMLGALAASSPTRSANSICQPSAYSICQPKSGKLSPDSFHIRRYAVAYHLTWTKAREQGPTRKLTYESP